MVYIDVLRSPDGGFTVPNSPRSTVPRTFLDEYTLSEYLVSCGIRRNTVAEHIETLRRDYATTFLIA